MQLVKKHGLYESDKIYFLAVGDIVPNPSQPRKHFDAASLKELSDSVARYGVLQPLTVRYRKQKYELIAGERRLRAAKMAGLTKVPCIVLDIDMEEAALIALVENLQRRDLNYIEEAEGLSKLIQTFNLSQEEAARRVGKSQSAIANKLRILKLPRDMLNRLKGEGLTERHARALLRLGSNRERYEVLDYIVRDDLTVAKTEEFIDEYLTGFHRDSQDIAPDSQSSKTESSKPLFVIKDVRLFLNTVNRGMDMMKQSGINAELEQGETDTDMLITIKIPKHKSV